MWLRFALSECYLGDIGQISGCLSVVNWDLWYSLVPFLNLQGCAEPDKNVRYRFYKDRTEPNMPHNSKTKNSVSAVRFSKNWLQRFQGRFPTLSHSQFIFQHDKINSQSIFKPPPPVGAGGGYIFSRRPSVRASVRPSIRDSRGSFMFPRYLQYLLTDFRQTCHWCISGQRWTD